MSLTTTRRTRRFVPVAVLALILSASACSGGQVVEPTTSALSPVVVDQQKQVQDDEGNDDVDDEQDVEEPVEIDVTRFKVGDTVPAEMVEEATAAGANVYATLEGHGAVVERGTLPEVIKADFIAAGSPGAFSQPQADAAGRAARAAGVSMVLVSQVGGAGWNAAVMQDGVATASSGLLLTEKEAIAAGKAFSAQHPDLELFIIN